MNLIDRLNAKIELFRLEQKYTKRRHRRSTFVSDATYVDGEYVYASNSPHYNPPPHSPSAYASSTSSMSMSTSNSSPSISSPSPTKRANFPTVRFSSVDEENPFEEHPPWHERRESQRMDLRAQGFGNDSRVVAGEPREMSMGMSKKERRKSAAFGSFSGLRRIGGDKRRSVAEVTVAEVDERQFEEEGVSRAWEEDRRY